MNKKKKPENKGQKPALPFEIAAVPAICAAFLFLEGGGFSRLLQKIGLSTGNPGAEHTAGVILLYIFIAALSSAILVLKGKPFGISPSAFAKSASESLFKRTLPISLFLFLLTYALFYFVFSGILPYPASPIAFIPVFLAVRFAIVLVEETFLKSVIQSGIFPKGGFSVGVSAIVSGILFGFSTNFLPVIPNIVLGFAIGAMTSYLYEKEGTCASAIIARTIYETLLLTVLV